jgi:hypothetical protein
MLCTLGGGAAAICRCVDISCFECQATLSSLQWPAGGSHRRQPLLCAERLTWQRHSSLPGARRSPHLIGTGEQRRFQQGSSSFAGFPRHTRVACCKSMPMCFAGCPVVSCTASKPAMCHALSLSRRVTQHRWTPAFWLQGSGAGTILSARRWQRRTRQARQQWLRGVSAGERRCCHTEFCERFAKVKHALGGPGAPRFTWVKPGAPCMTSRTCQPVPPWQRVPPVSSASSSTPY